MQQMMHKYAAMATIGVSMFLSTARADVTVSIKDCENSLIGTALFTIGTVDHWYAEGQGSLSGVMQGGTLVIPDESIEPGSDYILHLHSVKTDDVSAEDWYEAFTTLGILRRECYLPLYIRITSQEIAAGSVEISLEESAPISFEFIDEQGQPVNVEMIPPGYPPLHTALFHPTPGSNITVEGLSSSTPWRLSFKSAQGSETIWVTSEDVVDDACTVIIDPEAPTGIVEIQWSDETPHWYRTEFGAVYAGATLIEKTNGRYYAFFAFDKDHRLTPAHNLPGTNSYTTDLPVAPGEYWVVPGIVLYNDHHLDLVFDILDGNIPPDLNQHLGSVTVQAGQKSVVSMNLADFFDWMLTYESPE